MAAGPVTKGERTRQRLLELAIEHFGRQGYRATSVSEIARAAGLTQATAYAYFDNKESLFVAALDVDASMLVTEAHRALTGVPCVQKLVAYLVPSCTTGSSVDPLARRVLAGLEPEVLPHLIDLPAIRLATDLMVDDIREPARTPAWCAATSTRLRRHRRRGHDPQHAHRQRCRAAASSTPATRAGSRPRSRPCSSRHRPDPRPARPATLG